MLDKLVARGRAEKCIYNAPLPVGVMMASVVSGEQDHRGPHGVVQLFVGQPCLPPSGAGASFNALQHRAKGIDVTPKHISQGAPLIMDLVLCT